MLSAPRPSSSRSAAIRNGDQAKARAIGKSHDQEQLEERLRRLSGVAAVIRVGGGTDVEIKERLQRFENAKNSMRGALREGVLPGGGTALLRAREALRDLPREPIDVRCGVDIVARAIAEPARLIGANMGEDPAQVLTRILGGASSFFGLDARRGRFGDLYELGVLDPLIVTRLALQEAASAASLLMTSECVITEIPPEDPTMAIRPSGRTLHAKIRAHRPAPANRAYPARGNRFSNSTGAKSSAIFLVFKGFRAQVDKVSYLNASHQSIF